MKHFVLGLGVLLTSIGVASAEVFVADFNGDGKPDVLMSSSSAPEGFVVLINQGESDGKMSFRKTWPDVRSSSVSSSASSPSAYTPPPATTLPVWTPPSASASPSLSPSLGTSYSTSSASSSSAPMTMEPAAPATPSPAPVAARPSILPPPTPSISTTTPKIRPIGGSPAGQQSAARPVAASTPAPVTRTSSTPADNTVRSEWKPTAPPTPEPPATKTWAVGGRKTALFNYKDKTSGGQFGWLERGIANILKFDVLEVKSIQMIDRERTDLTFDPAWFRNSGLAADIIVTGEFEEAGDRLIVSTWFLTPTMSALREFKIEGDRADIFSLIEKVGARLKQELSSL